MPTKSSATGPSMPKPLEEDQGGKPLAATFIQEIQKLNLKFKNEDDEQGRGMYYYLLFIHVYYITYH
jgi:hypothetical protein